MKMITKWMQAFNKRIIMVLAMITCFSIESVLFSVDFKKLTMQERCIASWLTLSGHVKSIFDKKVDFDEIDFQLYPELAKFAKKHRCPVDIEKLILEQLSLKDRMINHYQNSSYIIVKGQSFDRLVNAERMRKCIELNNLDLLTVSQKYLYRDGNSWGVAALQADTQDRVISLSLPEAKQIFTLAMETGYRDWKFNCAVSQKDYRNFFYDKQGCIVCIDTEDLSFQVTGHNHVWPNYVPHDCKANYAMSMLYYKDCMQPEALAWVTEKVEEILNSPDAFKEFLSLPLNTRYDDPAINIEKVKHEFWKYMQDEQAKYQQQEFATQQVAAEPAFC